MMIVLVFAILLEIASAQLTYDCNCAFFATAQGAGQIGDASPIPFLTQTYQVDPNVCAEPAPGNNTCKFLCDEWGKSFVQTGTTLCSAPVAAEENGPQRCYGGLYCEALAQEDRIPADGLTTSVRAYYRMRECPEESGHVDWRLGNYEYPEALCCTAGGFYDDCYGDCTCNKADPLRYCECGLFAEIQFDARNGSGEPIPFKMVSGTVGDEPFSYCDEFEVNSPAEVCEVACRNDAGPFLTSFSLIDFAINDYNVAPDITYGQLYCNVLRSRRIFFNQYINTVLRVHKRAPFCIPVNGWVNLGPQYIYPERLCCNEDGTFEYPCIEAEEASN